jgi:hypothetical protein
MILVVFLGLFFLYTRSLLRLHGVCFDTGAFLRCGGANTTLACSWNSDRRGRRRRRRRRRRTGALTS